MTTEQERRWQHFDRMQKKVMATYTSKEEYFAESEVEQIEFYNWLRDQCGEFDSFRFV